MNENLNKIIEKEFLIKKFRLIKSFEGNTHLVFLVEIDMKNFIVRISKKEHKNFDSEMWALKQFEKWKLPCARLVKFSRNKKLGNFNYSILTYVDGIHPESSNVKAFESLSEKGLFFIHKKDIKGFGDINGQGIGKYKSWNEYLLFKFEKGYLNLKKNQVLTIGLLNEIEYLWREFGNLITVKRGKLLLGDLHNLNFFVKQNKFYSFIDLKSILSGDSLWDYALIYYYNEQFVWPRYIELNNENKKKFYFYCLLIGMNKIWFNYRKKRDTKEIKEKLFNYIKNLKELILL